MKNGQDTEGMGGSDQTSPGNCPHAGKMDSGSFHPPSPSSTNGRTGLLSRVLDAQRKNWDRSIPTWPHHLFSHNEVSSHTRQNGHINKSTNINNGEGVEKRELPTLLVGM